MNVTLQNKRLSLSVRALLVLLVALFVTSAPVQSRDARIKDIVGVDVIRENQLLGLGLVVGLNGTGDTLRNVPFTQQQIAAMLERLGTNIKEEDMKSANVASVVVTADLPAFARTGSRIDVNVSSAGDAADLRGGTLLVTEMKGMDGLVYAVAQGPIAVSGFTATGNAASIQQGVPTSGRITNGATVERENLKELNSFSSVRLSLHNPDLTTSRNIADAINDHMTMEVARALDPTTVQLIRPTGSDMSMVTMLAEIEHLTVIPDLPAKVIVDERTGIIVMGKDVTISPIAVAHGNLTITIAESPAAAMPNAFTDADPVILERTQITVVDGDNPRQLATLPESATLQELVDGLNALGFGPRDLISILQAIKASGAIQAELEFL